MGRLDSLYSNRPVGDEKHELYLDTWDGTGVDELGLHWHDEDVKASFHGVVAATRKTARSWIPSFSVRERAGRTRSQTAPNWPSGSRTRS